MKTLDTMFVTDERLETDGICIDYGVAWFRCKRAGGSNKPFIAALEQRTRPYRRAIDNDMFPREKLMAVLIEVFVDTCLIGWGSPDPLDDGKDAEQGRYGPGKIAALAPDGKTVEVLDFNRPNAVAYLSDERRADMFQDLFEQVKKAGNFRHEDAAAEAKK